MSEVDAYAAALASQRRERVEQVIALARVASGQPGTMEWGMPTFRRGDRWFSVADRKAYVSLYLGCVPGLCEQVLASDPRLKGGKGCVNVTDRREMPLAALQRALDELFDR